jgi:hypothetical protein
MFCFVVYAERTWIADPRLRMLVRIVIYGWSAKERRAVNWHDICGILDVVIFITLRYVKGCFVREGRNGLDITWIRRQSGSFVAVHDMNRHKTECDEMWGWESKRM